MCVCVWLKTTTKAMVCTWKQSRQGPPHRGHHKGREPDLVLAQSLVVGGHHEVKHGHGQGLFRGHLLVEFVAARGSSRRRRSDDGLRLRECVMGIGVLVDRKQ